MDILCPYADIRARMPIHDRRQHIQAHWAAGVFYERSMMRELWERFEGVELRNIYDVGACVGNHAVWFAKAWPSATVFAFEPDAAAYDVMVEALKMNGLYGRVIACPYALGGEHGRGSVEYGPNEGATRLVPGDDVTIYALDDLALAWPDLVKIDTEGMELAVLHGMRRLLRERRPAVYVEGDLDQLDAVMSIYGYRHVWTGNATPTHGFLPY